jgi:hypothetical protein
LGPRPQTVLQLVLVDTSEGTRLCERGLTADLTVGVGASAGRDGRAKPQIRSSNGYPNDEP